MTEFAWNSSESGIDCLLTFCLLTFQSVVSTQFEKSQFNSVEIWFGSHWLILSECTSESESESESCWHFVSNIWEASLSLSRAGIQSESFCRLTEFGCKQAAQWKWDCLSMSTYLYYVKKYHVMSVPKVPKCWTHLTKRWDTKLNWKYDYEISRQASEKVGSLKIISLRRKNHLWITTMIMLVNLVVMIMVVLITSPKNTSVGVGYISGYSNKMFVRSSYCFFFFKNKCGYYLFL